MTMQSNGDNKGLKLELDSTEIGTDDTAFDDAGVDEELDDSMGAMPQQKSRSSAKLLAGLVLVGLIGAGGYVGYQQFAGGNAAPVAAIPSDVPAGSAMIDPMTGQPMANQPMTADQQAMPADGGMPPMPMDGSAVVDPMMAGTMPADTGMQIDPMTGQPMPNAQPMDGGMPIDPATGMAPPAAPGMPEAVMNDGAMPPADPNAMPTDPMMGAQPMDGAMPMDATGMPADPVAGIVPPPADAPVPPAPPVEQAAAPMPAPVAPAPMPAPVVDTAVTQELQNKITTLESRLADMERELNDLRSQQSQAQPAAAAKSEVSAADLKALERRIDALATKAASAPPAPPTMVGKAAPMPAPKAAPMPAAAPLPTTNTTNMMPETANVRTAVDRAATSKAPVAAPSPVTLTPSAPTAAPMPAPSRATSQWQLRSAQPGRAWIAQQGSQEMRSVGVGDEVPGLGRILSIAQDSDKRWVVRGSMGSVGQ